MDLRPTVIDSESSYQFSPVQKTVQAVPELQRGHTQCTFLNAPHRDQSTLWVRRGHICFEWWYKAELL